MSANLWVPGVLVLVLGAVAGWWLLRRRSGGTSGGAGTAQEGDLELRDLTARRDELYARLRASDLEPEERTDLELQAARVLQRIDGVEGVEGEAETDRAQVLGETAAGPAAVVTHGRTRTLLTGFAFGGATAALIAVLIFWAGRDATERPPMPGDLPPSSEQPHPVGDLAPEIRADVDELLASLESRPDDLAARKRLALLYLASDQYVPAFEQASAVLAETPNDIDSIYVQGVVRMTMGQDEMALERLDRVLELFPEHVRAMTVKGLVFARAGEGEQAAALWNQALEVGGPQPQIENLLAMLDAESEGRLPAGHPTASDSPPTGGGNVADMGQRGALAAPGEYRARVEADVIAGFPQTGILFVALRPEGGGPPIAVKRIDQPAFPMLVNLGPGDMMMAQGGELPESGTLTIRLDQDGSASTRGENDLEGSAEMQKGELVTVFLEGV